MFKQFKILTAVGFRSGIALVALNVVFALVSIVFLHTTKEGGYVADLLLAVALLAVARIITRSNTPEVERLARQALATAMCALGLLTVASDFMQRMFSSLPVTLFTFVLFALLTAVGLSLFKGMLKHGALTMDVFRSSDALNSSATSTNP